VIRGLIEFGEVLLGETGAKSSTMLGTDDSTLPPPVNFFIGFLRSYSDIIIPRPALIFEHCKNVSGDFVSAWNRTKAAFNSHNGAAFIKDLAIVLKDVYKSVNKCCSTLASETGG
jgi:hypothetical protein